MTGDEFVAVYKMEMDHPQPGSCAYWWPQDVRERRMSEEHTAGVVTVIRDHLRAVIVAVFRSWRSRAKSVERGHEKSK